MKLNHLNLVVTDVAAAASLFENYFDFTAIQTKGEGIINVLKGADDFTLVLMKGKEAAPAYPINFHIGFMLANETAVTAVYQKLKSASLLSGPEPRKIREGFAFYFDFQNLMIEVGTA